MQDVEIGDGHVGIGTRRGPRGAARLEAPGRLAFATPPKAAHQRCPPTRSVAVTGSRSATDRSHGHAPPWAETTRRPGRSSTRRMPGRRATGIVVAPAAASAVTLDRMPARGRKLGEDEALSRGGAAVQHERRAVDARIGQRDGDRRVLHLQRRAAAVRIPVAGAQPQQLPAHREVGRGESRHGAAQHEEQRRDSRSSAIACALRQGRGRRRPPGTPPAASNRPIKAPRAGLEPATNRLTADRSTD